jgi:hypothetical protein
MQRKPRTVLSILVPAVICLLAVVLLAANIDRSADASGAHPGAAPSGWRLAPPVTYQNLTIFPVLSAQDAKTSDFATLDEALASGDAVVSEQGGYIRRTRDGRSSSIYASGPQVNQLTLVNRGKRPLLLLAGEVVSGGKQDRIIGKDRIIPVGAAPLPLDVFCVEHGRWTGASDKFSAGKLIVDPSVRAEAALAQDQVKVWAAVRGEASGVASAAPNANAAPPAVSREALSAAVASARTGSYQKIYKASPIGISVDRFADEIGRRFDRATSKLKGEHVVGVVVAFGDQAAWSDIFASSELFDAYWPKLLRSYVVEAVTRPRLRETASLEDARDFLRPITGHIEQETEPGVYEWRKQSVGELSEIQLLALAPRPLTLHTLRVLRAN